MSEKPHTEFPPPVSKVECNRITLNVAEIETGLAMLFLHRCPDHWGTWRRQCLRLHGKQACGERHDTIRRGFIGAAQRSRARSLPLPDRDGNGFLARTNTRT